LLRSAAAQAAAAQQATFGIAQRCATVNQEVEK